MNVFLSHAEVRENQGKKRGEVEFHENRLEIVEQSMGIEQREEVQEERELHNEIDHPITVTSYAPPHHICPPLEILVFIAKLLPKL